MNRWMSILVVTAVISALNLNLSTASFAIDQGTVECPVCRQS